MHDKYIRYDNDNQVDVVTRQSANQSNIKLGIERNKRKKVEITLQKMFEDEQPVKVNNEDTDIDNDNTLDTRPVVTFSSV